MGFLLGNVDIAVRQSPTDLEIKQLWLLVIQQLLGNVDMAVLPIPK
jgi:hypothetical protein